MLTNQYLSLYLCVSLVLYNYYFLIVLNYFMIMNKHRLLEVVLLHISIINLKK